jgi:hypothetical protein
MKMEAVRSSETSANFQPVTRSHILDHSIFNSHSRDNFKSDMYYFFIFLLIFPSIPSLKPAPIVDLIGIDFVNEVARNGQCGS